jgi:hypothetical protein
MGADKLRQEALALPLDERAALAKDLLLSLDDAADDAAEQTWLEELDRRAQAVATEAKLVDWSDAEQRISARLTARRAASSRTRPPGMRTEVRGGNDETAFALSR